MYSSLEEVRNDCLKCERCALCSTRNNLVFGEGVPDAKIMFVGEGPGEQEDLQGRPFVGRSGRLLDYYLDAFDLDRTKNVYIANIVKCRPPQNRDPRPDEEDACIHWLREQTRVINPKIIVCLGRIAATKLISPDFKVTVQHGEFFKKGRFLMMGTFHPAALLRNPGNKPLAYEDFIALREKIKEVL
ncbi:MAG: uracil-DNA glycosylase [Clostridiales bacterium]|nr:uracil-DNA glycosylase [Clostridiales bacterium]